MGLFEEYINKKRDKFYQEEPEKGHLERFANKLDGYSVNSSGFSWSFLLRAAAIVVLVVFSSLWAYENFLRITTKSELSGLSEISTEYRDAEIYYTNLINHKYSEIKSYQFHNSPEEQDILLKELSEMDSIYKSLEDELKKEGSNQMIIYAMIRHYQIKLNIMIQILELLDQVKSMETIKTNNDENISI